MDHGTTPGRLDAAPARRGDRGCPLGDGLPAPRHRARRSRRSAPAVWSPRSWPAWPWCSCVVGLLGRWAAQRLAEREAVNDAATIADVLADAVITPALTDALADGEPAAVAAMDAVVRERVLGPRIVRVKLWSPDGSGPLRRRAAAGRPHLRPQRRPACGPLAAADQGRGVGPRRVGERVRDRRTRCSRSTGRSGPRAVASCCSRPTPRTTPCSERSSQLWRGFAGVTVSSLLMLVVLTAPILWRLLAPARARPSASASGCSNAPWRPPTPSAGGSPAPCTTGRSRTWWPRPSSRPGRRPRPSRPGSRGWPTTCAGWPPRCAATSAPCARLLVDIYPPSLASAGLATALADLAQSGASRGLAVAGRRRGRGRPRAGAGRGAAGLPRRPGVPAQQREARRSVHRDDPARREEGDRGRPRRARRRTGLRHRPPRRPAGGPLRPAGAGRPRERRGCRPPGRVPARVPAPTGGSSSGRVARA